MRCIFILPVILFVVNSFAQDTGTISYPVKINLLEAPSCTLTHRKNLDYGALEIPASGRGTASFDLTVDDRNFSYEDGSGTSLGSSGIPTTGKLDLTGSNAEGAILLISPTYHLQRTGCEGEFDADGRCQIPYSMESTWSTSESGSIWKPRTNVDWTLELRSADPVTIHFQFGGEISIPAGIPARDYRNRLAISILCLSG